MNIYNKVAMFFNSPYKLVEHYKNNKGLGAAITIILSASVIMGFISPVLRYFAYRNEFKIALNPLSMIGAFTVSILTYLFACGILTAFSRIAGKGCSYRSVVSTWCFSYIPTTICSIVVTIYECTFYYFIGNKLLMLLINTVFLLLLIWKAIFYFIEARIALGLSGFRLAAATAAIGVVFAVLVIIDMKAGLIVPML